jgi:hypothetical protein
MKKLFALLIYLAGGIAFAIDEPVITDTTHPRATLAPLSGIQGFSKDVRVYVREDGRQYTLTTNSKVVLYYGTNLTSIYVGVATNTSVDTNTGSALIETAPLASGNMSYALAIIESGRTNDLGTGLLTVKASSFGGAFNPIPGQTIDWSTLIWTGSNQPVKSGSATINGIPITNGSAFTVSGIGGVNSVFSRTGTIVAVAGDYTAAQVGAVATNDTRYLASVTNGGATINGSSISNGAAITISSGDMLAATYDPIGGASQVAFTSNLLGYLQTAYSNYVASTYYTAANTSGYVSASVTNAHALLTLDAHGIGNYSNWIDLTYLKTYSETDPKWSAVSNLNYANWNTATGLANTAIQKDGSVAWTGDENGGNNNSTNWNRVKSFIVHCAGLQNNYRADVGDDNSAISLATRSLAGGTWSVSSGNFNGNGNRLTNWASLNCSTVTASEVSATTLTGGVVNTSWVRAYSFWGWDSIGGVGLYDFVNGFGAQVDSTNCFAFGSYARAMHAGSFVWAGSQAGTNYISAGDNTFNIYAPNGFYFDGVRKDLQWDYSSNTAYQSILNDTYNSNNMHNASALTNSLWAISINLGVASNNTQALAWVPCPRSVVITNIIRECSIGSSVADLWVKSNGVANSAYSYVAYTGLVFTGGQSLNTDARIPVNADAMFSIVVTNGVSTNTEPKVIGVE